MRPFRTIIFLSLSFLSVNAMAQAGCFPLATSVTNDGKNYFILEPDNFGVGIELPSNIDSIAIGEKINKTPMVIYPRVINKRQSAAPATLTCLPPYSRIQYKGIGGGNGLYASNVQGVGLRMRIAGSGVPANITNISADLFTVQELRSSPIEIDFIKTGPISKVLDDLKLNGVFLELTLDDRLAAQYRFNGITLTPTNPTCTVVSDNITVPLGTHPTTRFTGLGTTTDKVPFSIRLSCSGGDPNTQVKPFVTLSGTTDTQYPSVLALTGSQVSGVGVEVLRNGTAQGFGAANRWQAGTVSQGTANFQIDLEARYRQIRDAVAVSGDGSANASATFTIDYQ